MGNGKIFYDNLIAGSLITVTTEAEGFEKEYLRNCNQGVVWRSTGITENEIRLTFDQAVTVKGIVVMNHNLDSGDSFFFEASDNDFSTIAQSETVDYNRGFVEVDWDYPCYRLRLAKSSGDFIQVGEIYLAGTAYEFERNYRWNYSYTKEISRNASQTTSGQVYRKTRFVRKGFNLEFDGMRDQQKEIFEAISENDYICFLPTGSEGDLFYGISDFSAFTHVYADYWSTSFTFMENPG